MPQLALGAVLAPGGGGIPAHLRPGLGAARRLLGLCGLCDGRGELQPPQRGRAQLQRRGPAPRQGPLPLQRRVAQVKGRLMGTAPRCTYIHRMDTHSFYIYIRDGLGGKRTRSGCPCHPLLSPRGWIPLRGSSGGWILLRDRHSPRARPPAPLVCQALAVPGCPVPRAGMAVLYVPSVINPLGCPGAACLLLSDGGAG